MSVHTIDIAEANHPLSDYLCDVKTTPTVVMKAGKPVAVVASVDDVDLESLSLSMNSQFLEIIERARATHRPGMGIDSDEVRNQLGIT